MTKRTKNTEVDTPFDDTNDLANTERGSWYPKDTDNFHWVLSRHTKIGSDGVLHLDHRYLDIRDISLVELIESENEANRNTPGYVPVSDEEIISRLEVSNDSNPNKDCRRWFTLLRDLQAAAGGKHSVRQINTKHINTRSRWSVPFKSLHEVGYLIKNQTQRNSRQKSSQMLHPYRTNVEKKNLASIKALKKYIQHRHFVELHHPERSYQSFTFTETIEDCNVTDDVSEPERWVRAMIRRHGPAMVLYMDTCAQNLANTFIAELNSRNPNSAPLALLPKTAHPASITGYLDKLIDEIMAMPKETRTAAAKVSLQAPIHIVPYSDSLQKQRNSAKTRGVQKREREQSAAPDQTNSVLMPQEPQPIGIDTSNRPSWSDDFEGHSEIKRSKSRVFSNKQDGCAGSFNMGQYAGLSLYHPEEGEPVANPIQQGHPDDEFFTSFINFDAQNPLAALHDQDYRFALSPTYNQIPGSTDGESIPPPDLLDAIVNLTVKSKSSTSLHEAVSYGDSLLFNRIASPTPAALSQVMAPPSRIFDTTGFPAPLPRSISDPVGSTRVTSPISPNHTTGTMPELGNLFGTNNGGFNFHMPYDWQAGGILPDSSNVSQQRILIPHMGSQSHSFHEHPNSFGEQPFSLPRHNVASHQPPEVRSGHNQLSTRLVYVNGQPSHIELTHDNNSLQPNPIILPISSVVKETK